MSGDMDDARQALAEVVSKCSFGDYANRLLSRCRPLLEPSDAERKLDEIRDVIARPWGDVDHIAVRDLEDIKFILDPPPPPRVPQVGDTVRSVLSSRTTPRTVLDVLDDGKVLRLSSIFNRLGFNYEASDWEVVE